MATSEETANEIHGPGSASSIQYTGGRRRHRRYEYSERVGAGFIEFSPDHVPTNEGFFEMLAGVTGVTQVQWKFSWHLQRGMQEPVCTGKTILVTTEFQLISPFAIEPFEFLLTNHGHYIDANTVSACFKEPAPHFVPEAWRILCEATEGKQLLPSHVQEYRLKVLKAWELGLLQSQRRGRTPALEGSDDGNDRPGSASDPCHSDRVARQCQQQ